MSPRRPCFWTRKLELDLVEFVREKDYLWKPIGNTNHHIQQKYRAYAEFAAKLGKGFTARAIRDRWVNIRSTFSHILCKVERSKETARTPEEVYVPCWPLWKPLQFLRDGAKKEHYCEHPNNGSSEIPKNQFTNNLPIKEEFQSEIEEIQLNILQRGQRTNRPRKKKKLIHKPNLQSNCKQVIDNLLNAMKPLLSETQDKYCSFGNHVTARLNSMRGPDAALAAHAILELLNESQPKIETT